jgi:hypothetical protein
MVKKTFLVPICFIGLIIFVFSLHGQGSKKTITLPDGEVVWDLNGEWDFLYEGDLGPGKGFGKFTDIVKITQQGDSFVGVKMIGTINVPKGAESITGKLDQNGFKKVKFMAGSFGPLDAEGQISEDGNKIIIDGTNWVTFRVTLTRK